MTAILPSSIYSTFSSCSSWLFPSSEKLSEQSEWNLLAKVPGLRWTEAGHPSYTPLDSEIEGKSDEKLKNAKVQKILINDVDYINTFSMTEDFKNEEERKGQKILVMTHGYGNGLALFYKNYGPLASLKDWDIHSIDWLGMGRSSRPYFNLRKKKGQTEAEHELEAEDFFVESFEQWRKKMNIEKMYLMGHSLGGFLSSVYALKYPDRVERLFLASPAGIPKSPYLPDDSDEAKLVAAQQQLEVDLPANSEIKSHKNIPSWVPYAWNNLHITPQWMVRMAGPYGPTLVNKYVTRRFAHLETEEQTFVKDYIYQTCSLKGSGEYALGTILSFGAYARNPLYKRLPEIKVPIYFIYGEIDWMDYRQALKIKDQLSVPVKLEVLPQVGHQLFVEKPENFNKFLVEELKNIDKPMEKFFANIDVNVAVTE